MEIELVKETKNVCKSIYDTLKAKHAELKTEGAGATVLNEIVADMKEAIRIYNEVNEENAMELHVEAINLQNNVEFKYATKEEKVPEIDDEAEEAVDDEEETEVEEEKKSCAGAVALGLAGVTLLAGIAVHTGLEAKKARANHDTRTETVEETETTVRVLDSTQGETEKKEETKTEEVATTEEKVEETVSTEKQLVLGEYGTFFDVTDDEQVNARAQYILDTYYAPFMNQLSENERSIITQENIANVIRVMAGELPVDQNGNKVMDANIVDNYGQMFTVLVGDLGSSPSLEGRYYNVPAHMFTTDGTELSEFIQRYDGSYQKIADGFNQAADQRLEGVEVTGGTLVREGIKELGYGYWNEWVMQGIFGDVNPYNFSAKDRLFAYLSSFAKYGQFAYEYNLNSMQAVCIPVCVNYETKEINEIPVNEIFVGYASGLWDTVIAKTAGIPAQGEPDSIAFTQDLFDELNWKYSNLQQRKLN